jgi:hypothetical protein
MPAIQDAAGHFLKDQAPLLRAILVCIVAGLVMGQWRPLRTHAGMALVGAASLVAIYRERVVAVYAVSLAAFLYIGLVAHVVRSRRHMRWPLALLGIIALTAGYFVEAASWEARGATPTDGGGKILDMVLVLRLVLFVWEFGVERIETPPLVKYLAWGGLPFSVGSVILRPSEFLGQRPWECDPPSRFGRGWWADVAARIGMLIACVGMAAVTAELNGAGKAGKVAVLYGTSPWGWYFMMAGAAGLSRLAGALGGIDVPVNFNSPYKSRTIAEFWTRWNITMTSAFRDMLFFNRWGLAHFNLYLNAMIVFLFVGIYHAVNGYWALWGLFHGAGFCVFLFWRNRRGPGARPLPAILGWALTYFFVCSCWAAPPKVIILCRYLAMSLPALSPPP